MKLPPALRYREFRLFAIGYLASETGEERRKRGLE